MGKFTYDSNLVVDFDDRVLAHLQLVIGAKLRRNESFYFSWRDDAQIGDGRSTVWLHPAIPVYFKFHGGRSPSINRTWVETLMTQANSAGGLRITPEPEEDRASPGEHA
ncbi:MAG: ATP-dependent ligase [Naasia sp.]|nr:ATP-dependent ligase [Naasia sp.]